MSEKYHMDEVQSVDTEKLRKLPRAWRKANVVFKTFMILLAFANVVMTIINESDTTEIPPLYFEIYSCVISLGVVVWNKILDEVKQYQDMENDIHESDNSKQERGRGGGNSRNRMNGNGNVRNRRNDDGNRNDDNYERNDDGDDNHKRNDDNRERNNNDNHKGNDDNHSNDESTDTQHTKTVEMEQY